MSRINKTTTFILLCIWNIYACSNKQSSEHKKGEDVSFIIKELSDRKQIKTNLSSLSIDSTFIIGNELSQLAKIKSIQNQREFGKTIAKSGQPNDLYLEALGNEIIANSFIRDFHYDSARTYLVRSSTAYEIAREKGGIGRVHLMKAICSIQKNQFYNAYLLLEKSKSNFQQVNDSLLLGECTAEIAYLLAQTKQFKEAQSIAKPLLDFYSHRGMQPQELVITNLLAEINYLNFKPNQALKYASKALEIAKELKDSSEIAFSANLIAQAFVDLESYQEAIRYMRIVLDIKSKGHGNDYPVALYLMARTYLKLGNREEAKRLLYESLNKSKENPYLINNRRLCHVLLYEINKESGEFRKALNNYEISSMIADSLDKLQKKEAILNLYKSQPFGFNEVQKDLKNKSDESKPLLIIFYLFTVFILLVIIYWLIRLNQDKKRQLLIRKDQVEKMSKDIEVNKLLLQEYRIGKSAHNDKSSDDTVKRKLKANTNRISINELNLHTQKDWDEFRLLFNSLYPERSEWVQEKFPGLTVSEQRVLFLIMLGCTTHDLSRILAISPESVRKSRYRLKQKLGLGYNQSIEEFISIISDKK